MCLLITNELNVISLLNQMVYWCMYFIITDVIIQLHLASFKIFCHCPIVKPFLSLLPLLQNALNLR